MEYFLELAIGTVITVITYFLKKTMDKIDKTDHKVQQIEKDYITEIAHEKIIKEIKKDIQDIKTDYTPKTEFKEVVKEFRNDLKEAQKQFLTKEDFIREQRKTETKLDEIYKLLLKERG
ncbi:hypothetical protein DXD51_01260 [Eubacterium sp. TM05-53]|nr:hypothetical protein DXD51_01260 [Eubacterium sp. TM05-53]